MTTQEFLKENREEVVNYYNDNIKNFHNITLKDFMLDVMNNFKKITISEGLKKMDLFSNLQDAKSRLGTWDNQVAVTYTTPYSESNHAKAVAYHGADKVRMMSSAK
jgi:antitoxin component YwqK of YwqJK toxin-antitoxin module